LGDDGLPNYQKALEIDDQLPLAHYLIGLHYRRQGDNDQAIAALQKAFELDPSNAAAAAELGNAYAQLADLPAAELWYRQAVQVAPDDAAFWMLLARFYTDYELKVEGDGLLSAQKAVELAPDSAEALDTLGFAQYLNGRYDEAEDSLGQAIGLDSNLASAHFHIGLVYLDTGRSEVARQHLENAVGLDAGGPIAEKALKALARIGITSLATPGATPAP
jgi:tetratricopeptide (TPR) repeat protein